MAKKEFGQLHGFTRDMFTYWFNKYQATYSPSSPSSLIALSVEKPGATSQLVSSGLPAGHCRSDTSANAIGHHVEIHYTNGVRLSLRHSLGNDVAFLRSLVTLI